MSEGPRADGGVAGDEAADDILDTLDEAGIGTWSLDVATGRVTLSDTCARLFGLERDEPHDLAALQDLVHPEDRAARAAAVAGAIETMGRYEVDFRIRRGDGSVAWLRSRGRVTARGSTRRLRGVVFLVDAEKRAAADLTAREAHLQSILDTVPEGMIVIDAAGLIQSFSTTAEKLFGYARAEVVGQNVSVLMPEPDRGLHDGYMRRYATTGVPRIIGQGRVVTGLRRDGGTFPMELAVGEMRSGNRTYFTGFVSDVSERQATQARLRELQAELVHVSRLTAMGEMASTLAHEINQPLAAVSNYMKGCRRLLETQEAAAVPPRLLEGLDKASEQAVRAGQIIRRLRDFVSRGETQRRAEPVARLIEEASALALVGAREQGLTTRIDLDPATATVFADRVQVQQVLVNLLRNALDAMRDAPRRELTVAAARGEAYGQADADMIVISVSDTGPGIAPEIADRLFQAFATTKANGMGVGLSISRTIVEAHGGRLWAERNAAGGASFHLTLPTEAKGATDAG